MEILTLNLQPRAKCIHGAIGARPMRIAHDQPRGIMLIKEGLLLNLTIRY
jgi:hypothetical protein